MNTSSVRIRIAYSKLGKVRFLGHRDVARIWERTLRKAGVPVAVSTGFTPRPRISFGLALPTGAESLVELIDVMVDIDEKALLEGETIDSWRERIDEALPTGFALTHLGRINGQSPSLQESVTASSWLLLVDHPGIGVEVDRVLHSDALTLERERKGESTLDDIRPGILEIEVVERESVQSIAEVWLGDAALSDTTAVVSTTLTTSGRGIRPTELVRALLPGEEPWERLGRILRTQQWIEEDGQRIDVLSASMAHPQACA